MKCIFCKKDSTASKSVEHIIPESLGNKEYILPCGIVCDTCNSYFANKIEKPLLNTTYFRDQRYRACVRNKKGRPPSILGVHLQSLVPVELFPDMDGNGKSITAAHDHDNKRWIRSLLSSSHGTLIVPIPTVPDERLLSRFLAKVAFEAFALLVMSNPQGLQEIIEKEELDPFRDYARKGSQIKLWPYHKRQLYLPEFHFTDSNGQTYEVLHEWTLLYTETLELYFVLALFGIEYAINMGEADIEGYKKWLSTNHGRSPLYPEGEPGIG